MSLCIRQATQVDVGTVAEILTEAARWLERRGQLMWRDEELVPARVSGDVVGGLFFIAEREGEAAGVVKFQLEDELFWPDVPRGESAFVHRLAVSSALLNWAVARARSLGRNYLRLDCEASRPKLRAVYEKFGFVHHSDRQVGPYFVSRYQFVVKVPEKE